MLRDEELTSFDWITSWQNATLLASICECADTYRVYFQPSAKPNFSSAWRLSMQTFALAAVWCLFVITGVIVYMPIMYTRKTDKILKVLQQIEANTRKP